MTDPNLITIHLRGLSEHEITKEGLVAAIEALGDQINDALFAEGEEERIKANTALTTAAFIEGLRFGWNEFIAQLVLAGVNVEGGALGRGG